MIRKSNKTFKIQGLIAYCVIGYRRYFSKRNETKQDKLRYIIKHILEASVEVENATDIVDKDLLNSIDNNWTFNQEDLFIYSTNIFFNLVGSEKNITDKLIVQELEKELKNYHPRDARMDANSIMKNIF